MHVCASSHRALATLLHVRTPSNGALFDDKDLFAGGSFSFDATTSTSVRIETPPAAEFATAAEVNADERNRRLREGGVAQAKFLPLGKLAMRKMVWDTETMISTDQIRKQLTDPEELRKITRDFDAEAAHAAAATRADEWDPNAGPPRGLSYLPRGAETFTCFKPDRRNAARALGVFDDVSAPRPKCLFGSAVPSAGPRALEETEADGTRHAGDGPADAAADAAASDAAHASADAAAAKTRLQIEKGKAALAAIKSALSDEDKALDAVLIAKLSTEYYRAIPTSSGRKAPPPLDSLAVVGEKEHQLESWLRMGFGASATESAPECPPMATD